MQTVKLYTLPSNIILIPFPFTDLSSGKVRPVLVLHISKGKNIICYLLSSQQKKMMHAVHIALNTANGLRVPSAVLCSGIATLDKSMALGSLGSLEHKILLHVKKEVKIVLGL